MIAHLLIKESLALLVLQKLGLKGLLFRKLIKSFVLLCSIRWYRLSDLLETTFVNSFLRKNSLPSYKATSSKVSKNY